MDKIFSILAKEDRKYETFRVSKVAFCKARRKVPYQVFESICHEYSKVLDAQSSTLNWKGLKVFAIDGTRVNLPASAELKKHIRTITQIDGASHYPQASILTVMNVFTGSIPVINIDSYDVTEFIQVKRIIDVIEKKSISLLDRGISSKANMKLFSDKQRYFVARLKSGVNAMGEVKMFLKSGKQTQEVFLKSPKSKTKDIYMKVRLIRGPVDKEGKRIVLATNLFCEREFKSEEVIQLYRDRWGVETLFFRMKNIIQFNKFHAQDFNGVAQEVYAGFLLAMLACPPIMVCEEDVMKKWKTQIIAHKRRYKFSFKECLELVFDKIPFILYIKKNLEDLQQELSRLMELIGRTIYRFRKNRSFPRYSKQPQKKFCTHRVRKGSLLNKKA